MARQQLQKRTLSLSVGAVQMSASKVPADSPANKSVVMPSDPVSATMASLVFAYAVKRIEALPAVCVKKLGMP